MTSALTATPMQRIEPMATPSYHTHSPRNVLPTTNRSPRRFARAVLVAATKVLHMYSS